MKNNLASKQCWVITTLVVVHVYLILVQNLLAETPQETILVPARSTWKYLDNGSDQGTAWRAPSFDDEGFVVYLNGTEISFMVHYPVPGHAAGHFQTDRAPLPPSSSRVVGPATLAIWDLLRGCSRLYRVWQERLL